jgi:hypothetical protein
MGRCYVIVQPPRLKIRHRLLAGCSIAAIMDRDYSRTRITQNQRRSSGAACVHMMRKNHRCRLRSETGLDVAVNARVVWEGAPGEAQTMTARWVSGTQHLALFCAAGAEPARDRGGDDIFCMVSCSAACCVAIFWVAW